MDFGELEEMAVGGLFFFLSVSSVYLVFILIDRFKTEIRRLNA